MKAKLLKLAVYAIPIGLSAGALYISSTLSSTSIWQGWLSNVSASLIMIPLFALTYEAIKERLEKKFKAELFEYIKKDVDSDILSTLGRVNKLFKISAGSSEAFAELLSMPGEEMDSRLSTSKILGFQIYKNWDKTKDFFVSLLRNPMALQIFSTEQITTLIRLLRAIEEFEANLFHRENFELVGKASERFKFVNGQEVSKYNARLKNRNILLEKTSIEGQFVVVDFGDFEQCYLDDVLNEYSFSAVGKTKIGANIHEIIEMTNAWLELTGNTFILDSRMFRTIPRSKSKAHKSQGSRTCT